MPYLSSRLIYLSLLSLLDYPPVHLPLQHVCFGNQTTNISCSGLTMHALVYISPTSMVRQRASPSTTLLPSLPRLTLSGRGLSERSSPYSLPICFFSYFFLFFSLLFFSFLFLSSILISSSSLCLHPTTIDIPTTLSLRCTLYQLAPLGLRFAPASAASKHCQPASCVPGSIA